MQLSSNNVVQLTGASPRQLGYWRKTGLIQASGKQCGHRRYTIPDVVAVKTIVELRRQGCSLQRIRTAVDYLRKHYPKSNDADVLASLRLLTDGKSVYILSDSRQIMDVVSRQTVIWVVNLGRLISETCKRAEKLTLEWVESVTIRRSCYHLRFTHDADEGGYVVQCLELPGAIEQGETEAEARANGKAVIESVLAFMAKRGRRRSTGRKKRSA